MKSSGFGNTTNAWESHSDCVNVMPSPLTHLAAGAAIAFLKQHASGFAGILASWKLWLVCLFFSIAPDLDAVIGIVMNDMPAYHNQASHSLLFGLVACVLFLPVTCKLLPEWRVGHVLLLSFTCYSLHLVLDWMTYGRGVKLFWPVLHERFRAPFELFHGVRWSEGVISASHVDTVINECGILLVAAGLFLLGRMIAARLKNSRQ